VHQYAVTDHNVKPHRFVNGNFNEKLMRLKLKKRWEVVEGLVPTLWRRVWRGPSDVGEWQEVSS
jgi:hypothetical protein